MKKNDNKIETENINKKITMQSIKNKTINKHFDFEKPKNNFIMDA
jgi:hypothetical protein